MARLGETEEEEGVSILEKVLKLLIIMMFLYGIYAFVEPVFTDIAASAQRDRVTRDFSIIGKAISRYKIEKGKHYQENSLQGLVDEKMLQELPKDPWGNEYVYNWFFDELISAGSDEVINTYAPGVNEKATEPDNDDKLKFVNPVTRLIYALNEAGKGRILRADVDALEIRTIREEAGEIQAVTALPDSKLVGYSVGNGASVDIRTFDFGSQEGQSLTEDSFQNRNSVWASAKQDQLIFESDRETPGETRLFLMRLPSKSLVRLGDVAYKDSGASVGFHQRRRVFVVEREPGRSKISTLALPDVNPQPLLERAGNFYNPTPSPNGVYLAFVHESEGKVALEVIEQKSKESIFRAEGLSTRSWLAWSPDGNKLAYQIPKGDGARLALAHPPTGRTSIHPQIVMAFGRFAWIK